MLSTGTSPERHTIDVSASFTVSSALARRLDFSPTNVHGMPPTPGEAMQLVRWPTALRKDGSH